MTAKIANYVMVLSAGVRIGVGVAIGMVFGTVIGLALFR